MYCDEPEPSYYKAPRIAVAKLRNIKEKIRNKSLTKADIEDTPLIEMYFLDHILDEEDPERLSDSLWDILNLPDKLGKYFYAGNETIGDIRFLQIIGLFLNA